jgi:putative intracellular protease/amidase
MKTIYIYVLDTMAEWEIGNLLQAVSMEQAVRKEQPRYQVKTFGLNKTPVKTIGGLTLIPNLSIDQITENDMAAILLPGAEKWSDQKHNVAIEKAQVAMEKDILVGAICGATLAIANHSMLNNFRHTSNSLDYLSYFSNNYDGQDYYVNQVAVADKNLITASVTGGLEWAKLIIERLNIYPEEKIDLWYKYFKTGNPDYYMRLIS